MATIRSSVGKGGVNNNADVRAVQGLLNANIRAIAPLVALDEDGDCGTLTIGAIVAFQTFVVRMARPDGRVDPGGTTLRRLNGETAPSGLRVTFSMLWSTYPSVQMPCDGPWDNQCAIRMSIALIGAGFSLSNYSEPRCAHNHARGAESLAQYLSRFQRPDRYPPATARASVSGRTGIVFFRNIAGFRGGVGDHIDVWDGSATKTGDYFTSCTEVWFWAVP
jgi:hypothetical protein